MPAGFVHDNWTCGRDDSGWRSMTAGRNVLILTAEEFDRFRAVLEAKGYRKVDSRAGSTKETWAARRARRVLPLEP